MQISTGELPEAEAHQRRRVGQHAIPLLLQAAHQRELDAVVEELSALLPKDKLRPVFLRLWVRYSYDLLVGRTSGGRGTMCPDSSCPRIGHAMRT